MSVVALHRYETLDGNDPSTVKSGEDPNYTAMALGKTMFQDIAGLVLVFGRIVLNRSNNPPSAIGSDIIYYNRVCTVSVRSNAPHLHSKRRSESDYCWERVG